MFTTSLEKKSGMSVFYPNKPTMEIVNRNNLIHAKVYSLPELFNSLSMLCLLLLPKLR